MWLSNSFPGASLPAADLNTTRSEFLLLQMAQPLRGEEPVCSVFLDEGDLQV